MIKLLKNLFKVLGEGPVRLNGGYIHTHLRQQHSLIAGCGLYFKYFIPFLQVQVLQHSSGQCRLGNAFIVADGNWVIAVY